MTTTAMMMTTATMTIAIDDDDDDCDDDADDDDDGDDGDDDDDDAPSRLQPLPARALARRAGAGADLMHVPALIAKFGPLPTCWSLERKHKTVKKFANHLFRSSASVCDKWDRSVLRDVTAERMHGIADDEFTNDVGLLQPSKPASRRFVFS